MNSAGIVESCLVKRGCSYLAQNNAQEVTRGVSFEVALLSGSVPFEAIEKQSENEIRNVTLPLGESGSKARRGPHPAATASDLPAARGGNEIAQLDKA